MSTRPPVFQFDRSRAMAGLVVAAVALALVASRPVRADELAKPSSADVNSADKPSASADKPSTPPLLDPTVPDYEGEFFTDLTHKIPNRQKVEISRRLRNASESSRTHAMLVVVDRLADYPQMPQDAKSFASKLINEWKIGDRQTKNGVLAVFAIQDRKVHVAKTLSISDAAIQKITRSFDSGVKDALRAGDVGKAMLLAADAIGDNLPEAAKTAGATTSGPVKQTTKTVRERKYHNRTPDRILSPDGESSIFGWVCLGLVVVLIIAAIIGAFSGRSYGVGPGVGGGMYGGGPMYGGGGGGGFMSGMLTGGLLGYMFGGGSHWGGYGGYGGWGGHGGGGGNDGGDFTETTTTESWTDGGGGGFSGGGGGGFDSFGGGSSDGGSFDGGGSGGDW